MAFSRPKCLANRGFVDNRVQRSSRRAEDCMAWKGAVFCPAWAPGNGLSDEQTSGGEMLLAENDTSANELHSWQTGKFENFSFDTGNKANYYPD